jgi:hypothetical protein
MKQLWRLHRVSRQPLGIPNRHFPSLFPPSEVS